MESVLSKIKNLTEEFVKDADKAESGNKVAGTRARVKSVALRNLLKEWRLASTK